MAEMDIQPPAEPFEVEAEDDDLEDYAETMIGGYYRTTEPYFPIQIGDTIGSRYRIDHKVGFGDLCTVWLARDLVESKDVAVKVMVKGNLGRNEKVMQNRLRRRFPNDFRFILHEQYFTLTSPAGTHPVFVFPLQGPSLASHCSQFSRPIRMSAAKQLLEMLESLHGKNFVHRNLCDENIMWGLAALEQQTVSARHRFLGLPEKMSFSSWRLGHLVKPLTFPPEIVQPDLHLGGWGLSLTNGEPVDYQTQTAIPYCAPERAHLLDEGAAGDIWSFMAIFMRLYLGCNPFESFTPTVSHFRMVDVLGKFPKSWKGLYLSPRWARDKWYAEDEALDSPNEETLTAVVREHRPDVGEDELQHVVKFLTKGLGYVPQRRWTAGQLLRDPSFQLIMEQYGC